MLILILLKLMVIDKSENIPWVIFELLNNQYIFILKDILGKELLLKGEKILDVLLPSISLSIYTI